MSGARILTDAQVEEMAALREAGYSCERLARRFGVSPKTVRWQCLRVGADHPEGHKRTAPRRLEPNVRNGRLVRPFSGDEDARLVEMKLEGLNNSEIGRRLGRKPNSILGRLMTIAMNADRDERRAAQ